MLSTGMSPLPEIDAAVEVVRKRKCALRDFSMHDPYPSPPEAIGLNVLDELRAPL